MRGKVPEQHRAQFDELLEEARLTYPIRDERGVFSDIWASGLMRRAALAGGRRLADKGRIHDAAHFVDAGLEKANASAYGVNLLKAYWGDNATAENDFAFDYLPKITGDHGTYRTVLDMIDGKRGRPITLADPRAREIELV